MTEASCMTLAYAKSRVEASRTATGGEHTTVRMLKGRQLLHGRRYMAACTSRPTHGATYRATAAVYLLPTLHDRRARRLAPQASRSRQNLAKSLLHSSRILSSPPSKQTMRPAQPYRAYNGQQSHLQMSHRRSGTSTLRHCSTDQTPAQCGRIRRNIHRTTSPVPWKQALRPGVPTGCGMKYSDRPSAARRRSVRRRNG